MSTTFVAFLGINPPKGPRPIPRRWESAISAEEPLYQSPEGATPDSQDRTTWASCSRRMKYQSPEGATPDSQENSAVLPT